MASYINQWVEQKAAYTKRDLLLYALGIGATDLRFAYENDADFAAFPTYPLCLTFKGASHDVLGFPSTFTMEGPPIPMDLPGFKTVLDGERMIEMIRPLDVEGGEITLRSRNIGLHKRGTGALLELEQLFSDAKGPLYRIVSGIFLVGARDFEEAGVTNSESVAVPNRQPDRVAEVVIDQTLPLLHRLSGDYNPLHVEDDLAQMSGFPKAINHGLCTLGQSVRLVLKELLGNDPAQFKAARVRFASPVLPGQTLQVKMWVEGPRVVFTTTVKETGKVAINNAYVLCASKPKL